MKKILTIPDDDANYANGWNLGTRSGQRYFAKTGGQPGSRVYLICVPEKDLAIAIMCNTRVDGIDDFGKALAAASW